METKVEVKKNDIGYTEFVVIDQYGENKLEVRNVSTKNPESALQINITNTPRFGKRRKIVCFSLPKEYIASFIEALKEERGGQ